MAKFVEVDVRGLSCPELIESVVVGILGDVRHDKRDEAGE